jgi:hypothetical protein
VKPFGISVIEVVTGFVRSNILHHGLYAPDGSLFLPIKATIERIKYDGNANGMMADAYARSIVSKLMQGSTGPEIWEGKLAWYLRFIIACCPSSLMVCKNNPSQPGVPCLTRLFTELDIFPLLRTLSLVRFASCCPLMEYGVLFYYLDTLQEAQRNST